MAFAACGGGSDPERETAPPTPNSVAPTPTETRPEGVPATDATGGQIGDEAPEFAGIANWINSDPLTMEELRGKVVLIDFWTYTCINCIRTMPFLREWQEKYADRGFAIVGVHAPEFEFEKLAPNVERASADLGLEYAIAQDNDFLTWRAYDNRFWPAKYLVDQDGQVRYTHFGEGGYDETELAIRELLEETGVAVSDVEAGNDSGPVADPRALGINPDRSDSITRELYGGWDRNANPQGIYIAHTDYYDGPERTAFYEDPGEHFNQFLFLHGSWFNGLESVKHGRATQDYEDYIALRLFARSANAVIDLEEGVEPFRVKVTIEDKENGEERALRPEEAGQDIRFEDGESFLLVDEGRMYFVLSLPVIDTRELKFRANSPDFALFAMTFGAYVDVD